MAVQHVRLDHTVTEARFAGDRMPRLEFKHALFRTLLPGWHTRLYRAAVVVTTTAHGPDERKLVVDHQAMRFSLLYNNTWPDPVFRDIKRWPYKPVELKPGAPVVSWLVELRLRELRLGPKEWVDLVFVG
ncbi:MAG: hypothetical protein IPP83_06365 [Flavobacteriales bacterium]|nr:hypothetical protein [Flavobacteriales bacterium]